MTSAKPKTSGFCKKGANFFAFKFAPLVSKGVTGTQEGSIKKIFMSVCLASSIINSRPVLPAMFPISWGSVTTVVTP